MAVVSTFAADFTRFLDATEKAVVKLRTFDDGLKKVDRELNKFGNQFSGVKIVQDATLAAESIKRLGEEGGIAAGLTKLTANELQRVGSIAKEAAAKLTALGQDVPANIQKIVDAVTPLPKQLSLAEKAAGLAKTTFGQMFSAFTAASLVQKAVGSLVSFGKAAFDDASRIADLSDKLNIGTEAIQRMEFVAGQTGGSLDQFASAAFKLGARLSGGGDSVESAVRQLGLSFEQLQRSKPEVQFETVVSALGKMDDATKRNELGVKIFGKSFEQIAAGVAQDYDKIAQGASIATEEQIRALDKAGDAWDRFWKKLTTGVKSAAGETIMWLERMWEHVFPEVDREGVRIKPQLGPPLPVGGVPGPPPLPRNYVQELRDAEKAVAGLSKAQREQIDAALKLGISLEVIAANTKVDADILDLYTTTLKASTKATRDYETAHYTAADAKKELVKQAEKLTLQINAAVAAGVPWADIVKEYGAEAEKAAVMSKGLGVSISDVVKSAGKAEGLRGWNEALKEIRQSSIEISQKMSAKFWDEQKDRASKAGTELLNQIKRIDDARTRSAKSATQAEIAQAEHALAMAKARGESATKVYQLERDLSRKKLDAAIEDANREFQARIAALDRTTTLGAIEYDEWVKAHKAAVDQMTADWERGEELRRQSLERFSTTFRQIVRDIPGILQQAFTGGGGIAGAVDAIGSRIGAALGKSIGTAIGDELGGEAGEAVGSFLVKGIVKGVNSKNAAVRALTGFAVGGPLGALAAGIFGGRGPTKEELEGRETVKQFEAEIAKLLTQTQKLEAGGKRWAETTILVRDAYLATGRSAEQAERDVKRLWDSSVRGAEEAKRVAEEINEVLLEQQADVERLNAAIEKYGFTIEELGPAMRAQQLNDQAKELVEDWRVLVASGIDLAVVNERMSEAIGGYLQMAIKTGAEVPFAMKPILQSLIDQGKLVDANGTAITDLEDAGVTFAETMTQGFDRVVMKLDELIKRLQGAGTAISNLPAVDVPVNIPNIEEALRSRFGGLRLNSIFGAEPMASGGAGTVTKPTLFMAGEAGPEQFAFSGAGKSFSGGDTKALQAEVAGLREDLARQQRDLPRALKIAMQDALALA